MLVTLRDNSNHRQEDLNINDANINIFHKYSTKSISTLLEDNADVILFPSSSNLKELEQRSLWSFYDTTIKTTNMMGFLGFNDCNVRISSRFTESGKDYFLHYMLQKVFLGYTVNLDIASDESSEVWEFYYYIFIHYLNSAMVRGVYKEYIHKKHNNIKVKGAVDVKRHMQKNIPFLGRIAYNTREYSYSNKIIQLIRHTLEYIQQIPIGAALLNSNLKTKSNVETIKNITCDYHFNSRNDILQRCQDSISNPYWQHYEMLRKLCIKILNRESLSFCAEQDKVHGLLFDGAWLWEEYLATFMPNTFIHSNNKTGDNVIYLAENNKLPRYPDFFAKNGSSVLDAKYKRYYEDRRDDIHQMISYMYSLKAEHGLLVYPHERKDEEQGMTSVDFSLTGYGGKLRHVLHNIAKEGASYDEFVKQMVENEGAFVENLSNLVQN